ncbi:hypothetical protein MKW92_038104 [Papaver armeniacum]|nr:hypothetical protein MKW92_038104 [Papaver armeniacum]
MAIIRRKTAARQLFAYSTVFAIAICLFVFTDMASAWKNICNPGDLYIDSCCNNVSPANCEQSKYCTNWCKDLCSGMGVLATQDRCKVDAGGMTLCKCCCQRTPPSPCDPPYPAQDDSDWTGPAPFDNEICTAGQTSVKIKRTDGKDCMSKSLCPEECQKLGLLAARTECAANIANIPAGTAYTWYEMCCCGTSIPPPPPPCPSPPPPPPPPPPPAPCSCCNTDVNVTISVKSGQSPSPPSSTYGEL